MAQRIDLTTEDLSISVDTAIRNINAGEVIVAPSEFGYIYLCDAFKHDAVKAFHKLAALLNLRLQLCRLMLQMRQQEDRYFLILHLKTYERGL